MTKRRKKAEPDTVRRSESRAPTTASEDTQRHEPEVLLSVHSHLRRPVSLVMRCQLWLALPWCTTIKLTPCALLLQAWGRYHVEERDTAPAPSKSQKRTAQVRSYRHVCARSTAPIAPGRCDRGRARLCDGSWETPCTSDPLPTSPGLKFSATGVSACTCTGTNCCYLAVSSKLCWN